MFSDHNFRYLKYYGPIVAAFSNCYRPINYYTYSMTTIIWIAWGEFVRSPLRL